MTPIREPAGRDGIRMQRILFATNFTEASAAALPYAAALARAFAAEICVLHVIPAERYEHLRQDHLEDALREMKQEAASRIRGLLSESRFSDIPFRVTIDHGEVLTVVAAFAVREDADLIVAGSHGRHGIQKLISPAVDEEIACAASRPVLLIGPEVSIEPEAETHIHGILHATNFEPKSMPALQYAYALAETFAAELYLMHVAENVWREPLSTRMTAEAFCRMRMLEKGLPEHTPALEPHFIVDFGPRETLILEAAEQQDVQLIVMGLPAIAHPELSSHLPGPLAYDIASRARCPVLVVRNAPAAEVSG